MTLCETGLLFLCLVYAKLKIIARLTLGLFKSPSPRIYVLHAQR